MPVVCSPVEGEPGVTGSKRRLKMIIWRQQCGKEALQSLQYLPSDHQNYCGHCNDDHQNYCNQSYADHQNHYDDVILIIRNNVIVVMLIIRIIVMM